VSVWCFVFAVFVLVWLEWLVEIRDVRPAFQRWRHSGVSVWCFVFAVFVLVWLKRLVKM
jgi:hypothetical protein